MTARYPNSVCVNARIVLLGSVIGISLLTACKPNDEAAPAPGSPVENSTPDQPPAAPEMPSAQTMPADPTMPAPPTDAAASAPAASGSPLQVASVELGNAVDADGRVDKAATSFAGKDTIYASIATTGSVENATIDAKWTYQDGQVVNADSRTVTTTGPAVHTFSINSPEGLPAGDYQVELTINGTSAGSYRFTIK